MSSKLKFKVEDVQRACEEYLLARETRINERIESRIQDFMKKKRYYFFGSTFSRQESHDIIHGVGKYASRGSCDSYFFKNEVERIRFRGSFYSDKVELLLRAALRPSVVEITLSLEDYSIIQNYL